LKVGEGWLIQEYVLQLSVLPEDLVEPLLVVVGVKLLSIVLKLEMIGYHTKYN